jgi:hypothetical protein
MHLHPKRWRRMQKANAFLNAEENICWIKNAPGYLSYRKTLQRRSCARGLITKTTKKAG